MASRARRSVAQCAALPELIHACNHPATARFARARAPRPLMAIKATIYKAALQIADMDRGVYADHALTLPLQPSETEERLMLRLLAFALNVPESDHACSVHLGNVRAMLSGSPRTRPACT